MAKGSSHGYGKNAPHEMAHVRTIRYPNGNQGFTEHSLGSDTIPGPARGAPLSTRIEQNIDRKSVDATGMNPFNRFEGNGEGVLGTKVVDQNGGQTLDSPVPTHAVRPHKDIVTKAAEVASYVGGSVGGYAGPQANTDQTLAETFPEDGVLGRD